MLAFVLVSSLLGSAAFVHAVYPSAGGYPSSGGGYPSSGGSGYPSSGSGYPSSGSGYPSSGSGYPAPAYGGYPAPYGFPAPYAVAPAHGDEIHEVDKLFEQLADIDTELHILLEEIGNIGARLVLAKRTADNVRLNIEHAEDEEDLLQEMFNVFRNKIYEINELLTAKSANLTDIGTLGATNAMNQMSQGVQLAMATQDDSAMQDRVAGVEARLPAVKTTCFVSITNKFDAVDLFFGAIEHRADVNLRQINARHCETGTVTLHRDDRRAEAIFQTNFGTDVPQVLFGIAGYEFDLRARKARAQAYPYGAYAGYGAHLHHSVDPNAMGVYVSAYPTSDSVTFNAVDVAFGDTDLLSVKVNYQACNIGPYFPAPHME